MRRRAKVKRQVIKDKANTAFEVDDTPRIATETSAIHTNRPAPPKMAPGPPLPEHANNPRCVSLANGEAARIEAWSAKHAAAARKLESQVDFESFRCLDRAL